MEKPDHLGFRIARGLYIYLQVSKTIGVITMLVIAICATAGLRLMKYDHPFYDFLYISREDKIPPEELVSLWILFIIVFLIQIVYWKVLFGYSSSTMIAAMVINALTPIFHVVRLVALGQYHQYFYYLLLWCNFIVVTLETLTIWYMYRAVHRKPNESA